MPEEQLMIGFDMSGASLGVLEVLCDESSEPSLFQEIYRSNLARPEVLKMLYDHDHTPDEVMKEVAAALQLPVRERKQQPAADDEAARQHKADTLFQKIKKMSVGERVHLAMKGGKEVRSILLKDTAKEVVRKVLESPKMTESEIEMLVKSRSATDDALPPLVLRRIFSAYNKPKATALVFDAAFWTTVAALFYPPAVFLLIAVYFGIGIMRAYSFRERVVSLTGIITALFLGWMWYFWTDRGWDFWHIQFGGLFGLYRFHDFEPGLIMSLKAGLLALLLLMVMLSYGTYISRKLIQTQKGVSVLYWFFFVGGLTILLQETPNPAHFLLIMPTLRSQFVTSSWGACKLPSNRSGRSHEKEQCDCTDRAHSESDYCDSRRKSYPGQDAGGIVRR